MDILSAGQLSPPFQLPHPVGAIAGLSLEIEVGIIGGKELGATVPVPIEAVGGVEELARTEDDEEGVGVPAEEVDVEVELASVELI